MEVDRTRLNLREGEDLLSPPVVVGPLYACATAVTVRGFVPQATLDVQVNGADVAAAQPGGWPEPHGALLAVPALGVGDEVRARQHWDGRTSDWSVVVTVRDLRIDYPAGPPRPQVNPAPPYDCGARAGVSNLLTGANVSITADGGEVGRVDGCAAHQGVDVTPDYGSGQVIVAHTELCGVAAPDSVAYTALPGPAPLPAPVFDPLYAGGTQLAINNLANGARFDLSRNGTPLGTWRTWGVRHLVGLAPPFADGETLQCVQRLCPGTDSPPGTSTVAPCGTLPAPVVAPIQDGAMYVVLTALVPDARIRVYRNGVKVGDGGGAVVALTEPIRDGDDVVVVQDLDGCEGTTAWQTASRCVAPPVVGDPSALDLFPVGVDEYDGGTITSLGETFSVKGTVYYPAETDGTRAPFNGRWREVRRAPVVVMAHGNHDVAAPSHLGFDYFQQALARMGFVAVSVFLNETNGHTFGPSNVAQRADLVIATIRHFQSLAAAASGSQFEDAIDFDAVGLMGHSRGGEAVMRVPDIITLPGVRVVGSLALAPTDLGAVTGQPRGYAYATILPAGDGDVWHTPGAKYYDQAEPHPFRAQLYVDRANHNHFNREWVDEDDTDGKFPLMSPGAHQRILLTYGCAFFRAILLGHDTTRYLTGQVHPAGVETDNVHLSFSWADVLTIDHAEDGNGIGTNSLGAPNTVIAGSAGEHAFRQGGFAPDTFFGNTTGILLEGERGAALRFELGGEHDLRRQEVWLRAAEISDGGVPPAVGAAFELGVEDANGITEWIQSADVGGVPRPFDRTNGPPQQRITKTMLTTLRFPATCLDRPLGRLDLARVVAVHVRLAEQSRRLALDDLQIVGGSAMSDSDATGRERRRHLDLSRLPAIRWVRFRKARYPAPREIVIDADVVALDEAGEVEVQFEDDPPIRALAPAVWIGDVLLTEGSRVGEGRFVFIAPDPAALPRGARVAVGWAGSGQPRPEVDVEGEGARFDGFPEDEPPPIRQEVTGT